MLKKAVVIFLVLIGMMSPLLAGVNSQDILDDRDEIFRGSSQQPHEMTLLQDGLASLQKRIEIIEKAKTNIEVEYFIYHTDEAGRAFTQALIEKAREGVKVRILLDHFLIKNEINPFVAHELKKAGVEVKFYNTVPIIDWLAFQYRDHRKLLSVDDTWAITGGRNIGNEYFDLDETFNFIDRDVLVKGPIVAKLRRSFDAVWMSSPAKTVKRYKKPHKFDLRYRRSNRTSRHRNYHQYLADLKRWEDRVAKAKGFVKTNVEDEDLRKRMFTLTLSQLSMAPTSTCHNISFSSDAPAIGNLSQKKPFRKVRYDVFNRIAATQEHLTIDSPYFILNDMTASVLQDLLDAKVEIELLTNSLHSTDAFYVASVFNDRIGNWIQKGLKPYVYSGNIMPGHETLSQGIHLSRWGTHSKGVVFDKKRVMIGTFNFDPRSFNYSLELALFCDEGTELAEQMGQNIKKRMDNGIHLKTVEDVKKYEFTNVGLLKRIGYYLVKVPASLFDYML